MNTTLTVTETDLHVGDVIHDERGGRPSRVTAAGTTERGRRFVNAEGVIFTPCAWEVVTITCPDPEGHEHEEMTP